MKLTATKVVTTRKELIETEKDLKESECNFSAKLFGSEMVFTIHDYVDFVQHQIEFNNFLLSSARN